MIKEIESNQLSIDDLAKKYDFSGRTIQTRIKELGFKWLAKEIRYSFIGDDESVFERNIDDVFEKKVPIRNTSKSTITNDIKNASNEAASTTQDTIYTTPEITSNNTSKKTNQKTVLNPSDGTTDNIDKLLAGKKAKKAYRGFYFDSDVLAIIDNVDSGIKSELINECLRKVFKEKGLL